MNDPLDLAARALRHRDRSRRQIDERLERAGVGEGAREEALDTLARVGYVDDTRFASSRAEVLAARGYGDEGIRALLDAEGVGAEVVEQALAALLPEVERARALVARHGASPRLAAQLQRKGFGEDAVETAAGTGFADSDPET